LLTYIFLTIIYTYKNLQEPSCKKANSGFRNLETVELPERLE